jgi:predicted ATP-binding protein involved in virulence
MKLRKLHIEDYKMFKDFDISFVDENNEALPIIVLAGVNGSGKTSLLEWIFKEYYEYLKEEELKKNNKNSYGLQVIHRTIGVPSFYDIDKKNYKSLSNDFFIYIQSGVNDIEEISNEFVKTFYFFLKEKDYRSSEITEHFHNYMKNVFDDLDIGFKYSHLDKDDNVWFSNGENKEYYYTAKANNNIEDKNLFKISELSTGEQTLLSKVLYLFLKDYKDKVILIDEPELSLHPSWQNRVLKIYENFAIKNNCQIIIATHSPHIIGSAKSEYIRLLVKEDDKIKVVDNFTNTYGLKFSQILTEVMGVEHLRPVEVDNQLSKVKSMIVQNNYDSDEFKKEWNELEELLGKEYLELKLLKVEIASRRKNVSSK